MTKFEGREDQVEAGVVSWETIYRNEYIRAFLLASHLHPFETQAPRNSSDDAGGETGPHRIYGSLGRFSASGS